MLFYLKNAIILHDNYVVCNYKMKLKYKINNKWEKLLSKYLRTTASF